MRNNWRRSSLDKNVRYAGSNGSAMLRNELSDADPNVWTGCGTQVSFVRGDRKSLICIRPVDRHAGRGLDGNTHAPVVSLAERLLCSQTGHQTLRAFLDPFHAVISIANSFEALSVRRTRPQVYVHRIASHFSEHSRRYVPADWRVLLPACSYASVLTPVGARDRN